ncbi:hypothetical protein [Nocardioides sp. SR21]|uniref:hypothetical protein n=1 Tax=Nocardioides sp. SR21 TaxID=2919501 RepID=UPI001FAA9885|nr:hypothetical protein [Nocardioides sp. SR21]
MTENNDTQNLEAAPPADPEPQKRIRDRRVGVVALAASTVGALLIGGTLGAVSGAAVGYGVGHHDHPDRPALVQREGTQQDGLPGGGMPGGQQFAPPNGQLPPGTTQEQEESDGSDSSDSSNS